MPIIGGEEQCMENLDIVHQNQHFLLTLLMESMLKLPEITAEVKANHAPPAPEAVKTSFQGERVDILA
jgi:hypothetical protein